jgi:hypothetical protein
MKHHSTEAQRSRLLKRLRTKPCSTIEARHELDIVSPAPRIFELRHKDRHNIQTFWTTDTNPGGRKHRVANYVLLSGQYGENKDGI